MVEKDQETGKDFFAGTFLEGVRLMSISPPDGSDKELEGVGKKERVIGDMLPCEVALYLLAEKNTGVLREAVRSLEKKYDALTIREVKEFNKKICSLMGDINKIMELMWDMIKTRLDFASLPEPAMGIRRGFKVVVFTSEEMERSGANFAKRLSAFLST